MQDIHHYRNVVQSPNFFDDSKYVIPSLLYHSDGKHLVSFDTVIEAMKRTGHDLPSLYKETAEGGLASLLGNK
jgi:L-serine dehydratase